MVYIPALLAESFPLMARLYEWISGREIRYKNNVVVGSRFSDRTENLGNVVVGSRFALGILEDFERQKKEREKLLPT